MFGREGWETSIFCTANGKIFDQFFWSASTFHYSDVKYSESCKSTWETLYARGVNTGINTARSMNVRTYSIFFIIRISRGNFSLFIVRKNKADVDVDHSQLAVEFQKKSHSNYLLRNFDIRLVVRKLIQTWISRVKDVFLLATRY